MCRVWTRLADALALYGKALAHPAEAQAAIKLARYFLSVDKPSTSGAYSALEAAASVNVLVARSKVASKHADESAPLQCRIDTQHCEL